MRLTRSLFAPREPITALMKKGLRREPPRDSSLGLRTDHCPDEEGIKTTNAVGRWLDTGTDHCPDEEGIKTSMQ